MPLASIIDPGVYFAMNSPAAIIDTSLDYLKILPSTPDLVGAEIELNEIRNREFALQAVVEQVGAHFDYVLIDGEAGIEQINRRVMKEVDDLIILSDTSVKGITVARAISKVARENRAVDCRTIGLVLNRVRGKEEVRRISGDIDLDMYGWIPEDDSIREFDLQGRPLVSLPRESPANRVVERLASMFAD